MELILSDGNRCLEIYPTDLQVPLISNAFQSHNHRTLQTNTSLSLPSAWYTAAHVLVHRAHCI